MNITENVLQNIQKEDPGSNIKFDNQTFAICCNSCGFMFYD